MCNKQTLFNIYKNKLLQKINAIYPSNIGRPLKHSHDYCIDNI